MCPLATRLTRARLCLALLGMLAGTAHAIDTSALPGSWFATGRYYELAIAEPIGAHFYIAADLRLTGTIGAATLQPATPVVSGDIVRYQSALDVPVSAHARLAGKDRLELLITRIDADHFEADFHLKSWAGFDPSMHPGELLATKDAPPPAATQANAGEITHWLTFYYLDARPELAIPYLARLSEVYRAEGESLAMQAERGGMRSFYATLLASDAGLVGELERQLPALPVDARVFAEAALARCDSSACARARGGAPLRGRERLSPKALDEYWGQFFATGAREPVDAIIAVLPLVEVRGDAEQMLIGGAAQWSLRSNAIQHPRVLEYCKEAAKSAAEPTRGLLLTLIDEAERELAGRAD